MVNNTNNNMFSYLYSYFLMECKFFYYYYLFVALIATLYQQNLLYNLNTPRSVSEEQHHSHLGMY